MLITVHHRAGVKCGFADVRMFQRVKCGHISWILSADVTSKVRRCGCWKSITFCLLSYSSGVRTDCYAVIWYRARPVCDSWVCYTLDWCYAYGQPCAYVMKFYAYGHPLCTRAAVCIDTPMLCIRPHSTQFPLVSLLEASFSVCQCPWVDHGLWPRECRRYFLSIPVHLCMCLCVLCLILLATVQTLSLTSPLVHGNSLTSRPSALLATSLSPSSFPFSSGLPVCWTSPLVSGNSMIFLPCPVSTSFSLPFNELSLVGLALDAVD